jgi:hypothetical protein
MKKVLKFDEKSAILDKKKYKNSDVLARKTYD